MKLELCRSSYFGSKSCLALIICMHARFRERDLYILQSPTITLKLENVGGRLYSIFEKCMKRQLMKINHSCAKDLFYLICAYIRISRRNSFPPFRQRKLCIFKQQFVWSKISLYMKIQVLTNFDTQ